MAKVGGQWSINLRDDSKDTNLAKTSDHENWGGRRKRAAHPSESQRPMIALQFAYCSLSLEPLNWAEYILNASSFYQWLIHQEKEKLYVELKHILARQPGPEVAEQIQIYQVSLKEKTKQMKSMASELNMYEAQVRADDDLWSSTYRQFKSIPPQHKRVTHRKKHFYFSTRLFSRCKNTSTKSSASRGTCKTSKRSISCKRKKNINRKRRSELTAWVFLLAWLAEWVVVERRDWAQRKTTTGRDSPEEALIYDKRLQLQKSRPDRFRFPTMPNYVFSRVHATL